MAETARKTVYLKLEEGLHMRPCSMLQQVAGGFAGTATLQSGDRTADLKSIFDLLGMGLENGSTAEVIAEGEGAGDFVAKLAAMFDNDFAPDD